MQRKEIILLFMPYRDVVYSMELKIINLQTRLYLIAVIILIVGLSSAILIYKTAKNNSDNSSGYEIESGNVYPNMPEDSKMYRHDLELYGGRANVIADDFRRWFEGLWHGTSLAFIVGCITFIISFGFFFVAYRIRNQRHG
jgi:hypothetical protein